MQPLPCHRCNLQKVITRFLPCHRIWLDYRPRTGPLDEKFPLDTEYIYSSRHQSRPIHSFTGANNQQFQTCNLCQESITFLSYNTCTDFHFGKFFLQKCDKNLFLISAIFFRLISYQLVFASWHFDSLCVRSKKKYNVGVLYSLGMGNITANMQLSLIHKSSFLRRNIPPPQLLYYLHFIYNTVLLKYDDIIIFH